MSRNIRAGHDDSADGGDRRDEGLARAVELAVGELVPQLDRGEEEEHGEQAVGDPVAERELQPEQRNVEMQVARREQGGRERPNWRGQARRGGDHEQRGREPLRSKRPHASILPDVAVEPSRPIPGADETRCLHPGTSCNQPETR